MGLVSGRRLRRRRLLLQPLFGNAVRRGRGGIRRTLCDARGPPCDRQGVRICPVAFVGGIAVKCLCGQIYPREDHGR